MNGLDLFSGIAGNTLGLREYVNTIAYCEAERHAQSVLLSRMQDGRIQKAPIWDDIKTLTGKHFDIKIDIIIAGFPCQDISAAGRGAGLEGERSGLFFEVCRLVKEISPEFVFLENVPTIRTRGLLQVINSLTNLRYDCRWTRLSAAEIGAPHLRQRWFLLAHCGERFRDEKKFMANSYERGLSATRTSQQTTGFAGENLQRSWWAVEPNVGRVANGVPRRVDRIKRLGNAVVPLQAKTAFERLIGKV